MSNHDILGVSPKATKEEIKKAYHKLSMIHHPDRGGSNEQFIKIKNAYEALMDFNPNKTHNMHFTSYDVVVESLLNWYTGDMEHTFMLSNIMSARLIHNGQVLHTWPVHSKFYIILTVPKKTLLKTNFSYTLDFTSRDGTIYSLGYSFKDPRNWLRKIIDYLIY